MKPFAAWVISTSQRNGYVGRYWWFEGSPNIPEQFAGCKVAMFKRRQDARKHLPQIHKSFPKAKVVRVMVTLVPQAE